MPKDGFYEESATNARANREAKFYTMFKVAAFVFFVIAALILLFAFTYVPYVLAGTQNPDTGEVNTLVRTLRLVEYFGFIAITVGAGVLCWFLKNRFNISYDYTFVEDELRITKVFNGKKRKFLTTIKADRVLQVGWVDSDAYESALRGVPHKKPVVVTPNKEASEGKEFIYILQSTTIEKQVYVIECRRQLLENLVYAVGRNKLVK